MTRLNDLRIDLQGGFLESAFHAELARLTACATCDGSGEVMYDSGVHGGRMPDQCPDCGGSGRDVTRVLGALRSLLKKEPY